MLADIHEIERILEKVEWGTLVFFAALFVLMELLTHLGLIDFIAQLTVGVIEVCVCLSVCLSVHLSVCLSVCLSSSLSVCLSLSVCVFIIVPLACRMYLLQIK